MQEASAAASPSKPEVAVQEARFGVYAIHDGVLLSWWLQRPEPAMIDAWMTLVRTFIHSPRARLNIVVVPEAIGVPSPESREGMAKLHVEFSARGIVPALIVQGRGFVASLIVGFSSAIALFSKKSRPVIVAHDVEQLLTKLPPSTAPVHTTVRAMYEAAARRAHGA
jgi:hypothetical protein